MAKKVRSIRQNLDDNERLESTSYLDDEGKETARFNLRGDQISGEGLGPKVVDGVREMGKSSRGGRGDIPDRFKDTQGRYVTKTVTYPRNEEGAYNKVRDPDSGRLIVEKLVTWKTRDGDSVKSEDVTPEFVNQPRDLDLSPLGKEATGGYGVPSNTSNRDTRRRQNTPDLSQWEDTPPGFQIGNGGFLDPFPPQDTGQQTTPQERGMTLKEIQEWYNSLDLTDRTNSRDTAINLIISELNVLPQAAEMALDLKGDFFPGAGSLSGESVGQDEILSEYQTRQLGPTLPPGWGRDEWGNVIPNVGSEPLISTPAAGPTLTEQQIMALLNRGFTNLNDGIDEDAAKKLLREIGADPSQVDVAVAASAAAVRAAADRAVDLDGEPDEYKWDYDPGRQITVKDNRPRPDIGSLGTMDFLEGLDYGQLQSFIPQDRANLFNQMVARTSLGAGGLAPFMQEAAGRLRKPLDLLFQFGEQFPLSGEYEDISSWRAPDFSKFLEGFGGIPGGGAFRNVIDRITGLQGRPASGDYDNPFTQGAPAYFNQNPQSAFDLGFGAQGISPFNPFMKSFEDTARRRFNAALGPGNEAWNYLRNQNQFLQGSPGYVA